MTAQAGAQIEAVPEPVAKLRAVLERRGIAVFYAADGGAARDYVLARIPRGAAVMTGGSETVRAIGLEAALAAGNHDFLRAKVKAIEDREARVRERRRASAADYFVGGVNAVSLTGEIVNADGSGNRVAAYAFSAGRVFLVAGINKIVPDLASAMDRLRNHAAAAECRGLGKRTPCAITGRCDPYNCDAPERQCGKVLIIENEKIPGRITLVLVGQELGY
ncbi:MAG TPA: lactate utilization protein [Usitatibacter sp.]|nr:lactate utilization protein [Usitatibacter sp.]